MFDTSSLIHAYRCKDLEWRLIYVGSAEGEQFDQELDTCMVGPVPVGVNSFEFEASLARHHLKSVI